jgi:hypothetical protein
VVSVTRPWAVGLLALTLACATPVRTETLPAAEGRSLQRIAVAPPRVDLAGPSASSVNGPADGDPAEVVVARLLEALERSGRYQTISPAEVRTALRGAGISPTTATPEAEGRVTRKAFGADSVLFVRVRRFVRRQGGKRGAVQPASVWFQLNLRAPDGPLLWKGEYDEAQQGLTDDPLSFRRAMARGFRWVSSEELAAYGAGELVARMPEGR